MPEIALCVLEGIKFRYILRADTLCTQAKVSKLTEPVEVKKQGCLGILQIFKSFAEIHICCSP